MHQINFKTSEVAFYVQQKYDRRQNRKFTSLNWAGPSMLVDTLARSRIPVDFCNKDTVQRYSIVLVSLTSSTDWYSFIAERLKWEKGNYTIIVGGSGLNNIRPFLEYADIFVWGRAENIIVELVKSSLQKERIQHPSVCYSDGFSLDNQYQFHQSSNCYPYTVKMLNSKEWNEQAVGCQRKCLFCMYSWHRQHTGGLQSESGSGSLTGNTSESTFFQVNLNDPASWPQSAWMIFGLDGLSERLRRMVNKPITNEMLLKLFRGLPHYPHNLLKLKLYNIVGYPTETKKDWQEFRELIYSSNPPRIKHNPKTPKIEIHNTPFKASPCTPAATWPVEYVNHRDLIIPRLQHENCEQYRWGIYAGQQVDFNVSWGTESLPTIALWMLAFRGIETDSDIVVQLATDPKFKRLNTSQKLNYIESLVDIDRLFGWYTWDNLPTRYLTSYISYKRMSELSDFYLRKHGGDAGIKLASKIGVVVK
jgi:hypothetical protein